MNREDSLNDMLEIKRSYRAKIDDVFDALTRPEIMAKWFYGMEVGSARVESDFRVGGQYAIHMYGPNGDPAQCGDHVPHGEYLAIDCPNEIAFTWISEGFVDYSVVTISLKTIGDHVELTLRHELPKDKVDLHLEGWTGCLRNFERNCFLCA